MQKTQTKIASYFHKLGFAGNRKNDLPRELKIPGFSNYLHPFDEDHVIGIGRDTKADNGRVQQLGIKIALFNVADVNNPKVADDIIIGDRSTSSDRSTSTDRSTSSDT